MGASLYKYIYIYSNKKKKNFFAWEYFTGRLCVAIFSRGKGRVCLFSVSMMVERARALLCVGMTCRGWWRRRYDDLAIVILLVCGGARSQDYICVVLFFLRKNGAVFFCVVYHNR